MARRDSLNPKSSKGSRNRRGRTYTRNTRGVKKARIDTGVPTPRIPKKTKSASTKSENKPSAEWQQAKAGYRKQYRRVHGFMRRAEARGYKFDKSAISVMLPNISDITPNNYDTNYIINLTEGAKTLTPDVLYGFATAKSSVTGEEITGTERRKEERQELAQRGLRTKALKEQQKEQAEAEAEQEVGQGAEESFQEQQRAKDVQNINRLKNDQRFRKMFSIGEIVYRKIMEMLNEQRAHGLYQEAIEMESMLNEEVQSYGHDTVYLNIAQFDQSDVLNNAEIVIFDSDQSRRQSSLTFMGIVIRGSLLTAEDAKRISDSADADAYTNESS